jgi:hypothetical protein
MVNQDKLDAFMNKAIGNIGTALSANMVLLGDKLGLYKVMVRMGPVTLSELNSQRPQKDRMGIRFRRPLRLSACMGDPVDAAKHIKRHSHRMGLG